MRPPDGGTLPSPPPSGSHCEGGRDCILRTKGAGAGARNAKVLTHLFLTYYMHLGVNTGDNNKGHTQTGPQEGRGSRARAHTLGDGRSPSPVRGGSCRFLHGRGAPEQCTVTIPAAFLIVKRGTPFFSSPFISCGVLYQGVQQRCQWCPRVVCECARVCRMHTLQQSTARFSRCHSYLGLSESHESCPLFPVCFVLFSFACPAGD